MNKEVGYAVRNRRKDLKMTQADLAKKIGCNYATICTMEKGECVTSKYIFEAFKVLGLEMKINVKSN